MLMLEGARDFLTGLDWFVLAYFLMVNGFYAILLSFAALEMRRYLRRRPVRVRWKLQGSRLLPRITVVAPAYNEAAGIRQAVTSHLAMYYPNLEVVVVNDGSKDDTLQILKDSFDLVPVHPAFERRLPSKPIRGMYRSTTQRNLIVVDKENGGKADSLNVGINVASGDLVCSIDADTFIEPDALLRMVEPFVRREGLLAMGGTVRVANGSRIERGEIASPRAPKGFLAGTQVVEYLRAFLFGRLGWQLLGGNLVISGAFGLFDRESVVACGGYAHDSVGEDMELVVKMRRRGYETKTSHWVEFVPDPVAWTEAPESIRVLSRQRDRWHRGLADVLWRHRRMFFNPRYGAVGMIVYPYFVLVELCAPVVEATGLCGLALGLLLGAIDFPFAITFFLVAYGFGIILSIASLVLEETSFHRYSRLRDRVMLLWWAVLENLGFRQLSVWWRLRGLVRFLARNREWGAMERQGLAEGPAPAQESNEAANQDEAPREESSAPARENTPQKGNGA